MKTKAEILLDAFQEMRINGLTVSPDNEDLKLGLERLEDFMHEVACDLNYNFESVPDINSISGLQPYANFPVSASMALRLCTPYGKMPQTFVQQASSAMSRLLARVAAVPRVAYPSRQPMGRGNELRYPYTQFFPQSNEAPIQPETKNFELGDKRTFAFDFTPYLAASESISSYTATPQSGVTINSQSFSGNIITMSISAKVDGWQIIAIKVTGNAGSIVNRDMNFNIVEGMFIGANQ